MIKLAKDEKLVRSYPYVRHANQKRVFTLYVTNKRIVDEQIYNSDTVKMRSIDLDCAKNIMCYFKRSGMPNPTNNKKVSALWRFALILMAVATFFMLIFGIISMHVVLLILSTVTFGFFLLCFAIIMGRRKSAKSYDQNELMFCCDISTDMPEYSALSLGDCDKAKNIRFEIGYLDIDADVSKRMVSELPALILDVRAGNVIEAKTVQKEQDDTKEENNDNDFYDISSYETLS